jgi:hypothetical protein
LCLAWALSIHKSQGLTLERIHVDLTDLWATGHAYVALSRARSAKGVTLAGFSKKSIKADENVVNYYERLESPLNGEYEGENFGHITSRLTLLSSASGRLPTSRSIPDPSLGRATLAQAATIAAASSTGFTKTSLTNPESSDGVNWGQVPLNVRSSLKEFLADQSERLDYNSKRVLKEQAISAFRQGVGTRVPYQDPYITVNDELALNLVMTKFCNVGVFFAFRLSFACSSGVASPFCTYTHAHV